MEVFKHSPIKMEYHFLDPSTAPEGHRLLQKQLKQLLAKHN